MNLSLKPLSPKHQANTPNMPMKIKKSLQDYISKIKTAPRLQTQLPSKKWILSSCKHPRTHSFAMEDSKNKSNSNGSNQNNKDEEATLADVDRFLLENFKSLFLKDVDEETDDNTHNHQAHNTKRVSEEESQDNKASKIGPIFLDEPPPLDLYGSNRFFMTHGFSGSTTTHDEAGSSSTTTTTLNDISPSSNFHAKDHHHCMDQTLPDNCVAVLACTLNPYEEFKHSMQSMVEARVRNHERVDWDFMEELLFSHINLNEKKSYKFILSAFVDLITAMRHRQETPRSNPRSVRTVRVGKEMTKKSKEVTLEFESL